jgi:hypothetical protein
MAFEKVVSGGQTGVDRAVLDVARKLGLPCGGWCPQGRKAEDGTIAPCYPLMETTSGDYSQRTEWNVRDSDGTLVLTRGRPSEGTLYTVETAKRLRKPCLVLELTDHPEASAVWGWAQEHHIRVLNIGGPRESKCPGIYKEAFDFLLEVLSRGEHQGGAGS